MAVPTSISDLSTTANSNSPAGADTVTTATGPDEYLRAIQSIVKEACGTVYTPGGTADAITITTTPTLGAYFTGLRLWFVASGANTGAVTLNVSGLGAKSVTKNGTTALAAGDIPNGAVVEVVYDGTRFQMIGVVANLAAKGANGDITSLTACTALTNASGIDIKGTNTNDSAAAGDVGELVSSVVASSTPVNSTGTGQFFDVTSISLTAGDWDVSPQVCFALNGATATVAGAAVSITAGNSSSGLVAGDSYINGLPPTTAADVAMTIAPKRFSLAATTTVYLKALINFSAGTPQAYGRISARRVR